MPEDTNQDPDRS